MTRLRPLSDPDHLPALDRRFAVQRPGHGFGAGEPPPRILLLYGSLRERSFSRFAVEEAARLLRFFGADSLQRRAESCLSGYDNIAVVPTACTRCPLWVLDTGGPKTADEGA